MNPPNISNLPDEILIKIFSYLPGKCKNSNLVNAFLVCRRWNRIISTTTGLMNKLKLNVRFFDDADQASFKLTRSYRNARLHFDHYSSTSRILRVCFKILNSVEDHLTTLQLVGIQRMSHHFLTVLSHCRLIESMDFIDCRVTADYDEDFDEPVEFKNLKQLKLRDSSTKILSSIECRQLNKLALEWLECGNVVKFLNRLERCNELDLGSDVNADPHLNVLLVPKFSWNKLILKSRAYGYSVHRMAFGNLVSLCRASSISSQAEIDISGATSIIWYSMFNNCKRVVSLQISSLIPSRIIRNILTPKMKSIEKLSILSIFLSCRKFANLSTKLSNVTNLKLLGGCSGVAISDQLILSLQPFFNQITELTLPCDFIRTSPSENQIHRLWFGNLTTLNVYVNDYSSAFWWEQGLLLQNFCLRHRNLKNIKVLCNIVRLKGFFLSSLYKLLRLCFSTCDVQIWEQNFGEFFNWRRFHADHEETFGRFLTEDEQQFFV